MNDENFIFWLTGYLQYSKDCDSVKLNTINNILNKVLANRITISPLKDNFIAPKTIKPTNPFPFTTVIYGVNP